MQGTIIVIEGANGSGKQTQVKYLTDRLEQDGYEVTTVSFPRYDAPSSYFVRKYLNGDYGSAEEVGPYTGSLFYALDRFAAASTIREAVNAGKVVLLDRYVGSNMAHQGTKFHHTEERRGFFIWLDNLEFELLHIPRPSKSFVLRVPAETTLALMAARNKQQGTEDKIDLHEADRDHVARSVEVYDDMCQLFPKDFTRIDCTYQGSLLPIETIHELLWRQIAPLLPPKPLNKPDRQLPQPVTATPTTTLDKEKMPASVAPAESVASEVKPADYFIPEGLSDDIAAQYRAHIDRILELHAEITGGLTSYLRTTSSADEATAAASQAAELADTVLPLASLIMRSEQQTADLLQSLITGQHDTAARDFAVRYLPGQHAVQTAEQTHLIERLPRNELDALPEILYPYSSLPLRELQTEINSWSYNKKAEVFEATTKEHRGAVQGLSYSWDIISSVSEFVEIAGTVPAAVSHQVCSPRYGYQVPELLDEAGLSDQFEACFDISLGLYSLLQEAGRITDAQYAVLGGHTLRWKLSLRSNAFARLYHTLPHSPLMQKLEDTLSEVHPLLAEAISTNPN